MKKIAKVILFLITILVCFTAFLFFYYSYKIPNIYKTFVGQKPEFNYFGVEFTKIKSNDSPILTTSKKFVENEYYDAKLFSILPIKKIVVKKYNQIYVIPCGTPFGVKFLTKGVMVVDTQEIKTPDGEKNPSKEAGLKKGDVIEFVNEEKINSNNDLKSIVKNSAGNGIKIKYSRNFQEYETILKPVLSVKENRWLTGLWVRDSSAGIGTTTFCTEDGFFGGLGHAICDVDTGKKLPLGRGEVVEAFIDNVKKGDFKAPGELCATFGEDKTIGNVRMNTPCGLYGKFYRPVNIHKPVKIGFKQEAKVGKAEIYCTTHGKNPEKYNILVESIDNNSKSRNFVVKINDKDLLNETGGIVQGMSGSPIIQNNKLIGAVTHVFLNDSTRGYGIFAETMLEFLDKMRIGSQTFF